MKVRFEYNKKNFIGLAIALVLSMVLWGFVRYALWIVPVFAGGLYLILSLRIELNEKLPWLWTVILIVGGAVLSTFSIQYLLLEQEFFVRTTMLKWELNLLCVLAFYLFVLVCSARTQISCIISCVFFLVFAFIDYFVWMFRQNEFSFADLLSVGTGLSVASKYSFHLTDRAVFVLMWAVLYIALVVRCRFEFQAKLLARIPALSLCVLCCVPVIFESGSINTETWEQKGTYRNGYVLNFLLEIRDSIVSEPEGYDTKVIEALEKEYSSEGSSYDEPGVDVKNPTIIVIMNESFADLTTIGSFHTNLPVMPFIDSLKENTLRGYALSSVYAAKTPNSEWEFQTGNTMSFLPDGAVVYQQYLNKNPYSIVTSLKDEGYTCVAMHPYYETGWSRNKVYPQIGYDEMYFLDYFDQENILREYVTDEELYNKIIDRYESRGDDEKLYLLGITMQNHGGYTETYDNFKENYYKTGRSYTDANQFLSLVRESDDAVRELVEYFEKVEEPVELVFFGDHQPGLNSRFYRLLNNKGLSGLTLEELENLYKVPFFIWTNYDTPEKELPVTSINYLSTLALRRAGITLPPYNRFLADMMEAIPAINPRGYYSTKYQMYRHHDDAEGEEAEWLSKYEILQYNSMFDRKNRSKVFFPYWADD